MNRYRTADPFPARVALILAGLIIGAMALPYFLH